MTNRFVRAIAIFVAAFPGTAQAPAPDRATVRLPLIPGSVRFAVIGDSGTGKPAQYDVAREMVRLHKVVSFQTVLMAGDNIYGSNNASGMKQKFEDPYRPLLDLSVRFHAALGNHDNPNQRFYRAFNMDGRRYYKFQNGPVEFFALDSNYMDPAQLEWIESNLAQSTATWKICYFHHPLYSDGKKHGPDLDLRKHLEPVFEKHGVDLVLAGHEHFYERIQPKKGIQHIILGNSGEVRVNNIRRASDTVSGFDTDLCFGMFEVSPTSITFQVISRSGATVDSGVFARRAAAKSSDR